MKNFTGGGFWQGFNVTAGFLTVFFLFLVPGVRAYQDYMESVDMSLRQTATSTFAIVIDNASSSPLNAVEFELHFNPTQIQITDIVPTGVLCEDRFIITNRISNASGTTLFQCGTVTPFTGKTGTIATVYTKPIETGTSTITFGETTHVLAHDGYGTDATRTKTNLVFTSL
jgi:hypothetical protein